MIGEKRQRHHAGVVHDHVDASVGVDGVLARRLNLGHIGDVRNVGGAFEAGGPDAFEYLVQGVDADVHAEDLRPTGGTLLRNQLAEAAGRARHDNDLVLQVLRHTFSYQVARYAATTGSSSSGVAPCMISASAP